MFVLTKDQELWLLDKQLPNVVSSKYETEFDDTEIHTLKNVWRVNYGGRDLTFKFNNKTNENLLMKWYLSMCWRSYSVNTLYLSYKAVEKSFNSSGDTLDFNSVKKYLKHLSATNSSDFSWFKLFARVLVDYEFPGFSHHDGFELSEILANRNPSDMDRYYGVDTKITPELASFFRRGIIYSVNSMESFSTREIRDLALFCVCYETGARPIQIQRMGVDCFYEIHDGYCMLSIPVAKKGKGQNKQSIKLAISEELGIVLNRLIQTMDDSARQLFARRSGEFHIWHITNGINNAISKFDRNDLSLEQFPKIYPYDLRHNVAHTLAMSGASAEEIAYILGHSSLSVARSYINSTPDIAILIEKSLGGNDAYRSMMNMVLTGEIETNEKKMGHRPVAQINGELHFGIGTCDAGVCHFRPVSDCYGCSDFHPSLNVVDHEKVKESLQKEACQIIEISDQTGQLKRNPLILEHESRIREVTHVINRCNNTIKRQLK